MTFTTNATLLNDTISKKIIDSGVDVVFFSVDGASKETFEKIRVGANFERVKENIRSNKLIGALYKHLYKI